MNEEKPKQVNQLKRHNQPILNEIPENRFSCSSGFNHW